MSKPLSGRHHHSGFLFLGIGLSAILALALTTDRVRNPVVWTASPSDGKGTARVTPADDVVVSQEGTWSIEYTAAGEGIRPGGGLVFLISNFWGWTPPQNGEPRAPGFVTARTSNPSVSLAVGCDPSLNTVQVIVQKAPLVEGETVTLVYGDTTNGRYPEARARADKFAEEDEEFFIKVDGDGDGFYTLIEESPTLDILPGPAVRILVTGPSLVRVGEEFELTVAALDARMNRASRFEGTVTLKDLEAGLEHPAEVRIAPEDRGAIRVPARALRAGQARILATLPDHPEAIAVSDPVVITEGELPYRLYWGDLQIHSGLSDGTGTPEEIYRYARDVAGLQVAVLTDHDAHGYRPLDEAPELWDRIQETTEAFLEPGRFVTYLGFEWTSWEFGHKHLLYRDSRGPLLSNRDPGSRSPDRLWRAMEPGRALTISHHTLGKPVAVDWSFHDPEYEFLVEICSIHGSSEGVGQPMAVRGAKPGHGVQDALARGYRLGFVGSGDTHNGHPGLGDPSAPTGGVAGIYATELTREAVWEALRARRVYASSGPRVVLHFSINDELMGSELRLASARTERHLHIEAFSKLRIERLEIFKNNEMILAEPIDQLRFAVDIEDPDPAHDGDFYYVRLRLMHDQLVWSSPIWIDLE